MHSIIISEEKIPTTKCSYLQNIHYRARSSRSHRSHNGDASSLEHQNVNYCFDLMCYTYPEPNSDGRTGPLATLWLYFGQSLDGLRCEITTPRKKRLINLFLVGWKILYSWFFYLRKSYHTILFLWCASYIGKCYYLIVHPWVDLSDRPSIVFVGGGEGGAMEKIWIRTNRRTFTISSNNLKMLTRNVYHANHRQPIDTQADGRTDTRIS